MSKIYIRDLIYACFIREVFKEGEGLFGGIKKSDKDQKSSHDLIEIIEIGQKM